MNSPTRTPPLCGPWQVRAYSPTHACVLDEHGQGVALNISREHAERIVQAVAVLAALEDGQDVQALTDQLWR